MDGNGLLKTHALLIEDKMAVGAFGRARTYGRDCPFILEVIEIVALPEFSAPLVELNVKAVHFKYWWSKCSFLQVEER